MVIKRPGTARRAPAKKRAPAAKKAATKSTRKAPAAKKAATKKAATKKAATKKAATKKAATKKAATKKAAIKKAAIKKARTKKVAAATKKAAVAAKVTSPAKKTTKKAHPRETPFSRNPRPTVAVFGAGIAGLTAAHELAERGFEVTVFEPLDDVRSGTDRPAGIKVRLGGMAATQYLKGNRKPKPFPRPDGAKAPVKNWPQTPTGEHGFHFFPAYYLHLWDMLRRIPVYDDPKRIDAKITPRTVYDNVQRVITQAVTANGQPSLVMPREAPRSIAEFQGSLDTIRRLGFTSTDVSTFFGRIVRYLVTSPDRRAEDLEDVSACEFFEGVDTPAGRPRYRYSAPFKRHILDMPKILAAFDSRWGDARTNLSTYMQLNLALDRYDSKADGVLDGPTTEAWFDHWYRHLLNLGVTFTRGTLKDLRLDSNGRLRARLLPNDKLDQDLGWTPKTPIGAAQGTPRDFDYFVVATDAFRAELATMPLRKDDPDRVWKAEPEQRQFLRTMSTVVGLEGWATSKPSQKGPRDLTRTGRRNPLNLSELGELDWDRFQTLSGIQFFFDTAFQIVRGHVYFSNSEWGLSAINQTGFWTDQPHLTRNGYVSVMSVDIGDWKNRSERGKRARDCTPDELAEEVWCQITEELVFTDGPDVAPSQFPLPIAYSIDEFIDFHPTTRKPWHNRTPYLIPIVGDWKNRPGAYPWNPHGSSTAYGPNEAMEAEQKKLRVWQAGHGGYQVHYDKLVFAGTWCKTFTRMTTMEAACESGRHAVNAILDHYVYEQSGSKDERSLPALSWRMPFGFVDQELSSPIRQAMPAGDYCFIFDCENREPADARPSRTLDEEYYRAGLAHPWRVWGIDNASATAASLGGYGATDGAYDPTQSIIDQLQQWRTLIETLYGGGDHSDHEAAKSSALGLKQKPATIKFPAVRGNVTARAAKAAGAGSGEPVAPFTERLGLVPVSATPGIGGGFYEDRLNLVAKLDAALLRSRRVDGPGG